MTARKKLHADEITTDATLVRRLLAAQFPQWATLPIERVASAGTENAIYRLGDDMAVRLPLRPVRNAQVEKLDRWLPVLAPQLPLPIPEPLAKGEPAEGYPCAWSVCRWLDGEEAAFERLEDPVEAARTLAGFVRALLAIDPTGGPPPGEHNFWRGVPLAHRDSITRRCIAESEGLIDIEAVTAAWETDLHAPVWNQPHVWIHGDIDPGNLLVVDGRLSAVIDWGGLAVGDPCYELQPAWNLFRGESRDAYRKALAFDDATWRRGRGFVLSTAIVALPYYLNTNPVIVKMARYMIDEVLADHG
ncbi:MAG: aminoglycoside phosphotransferase family protein [Chloroflexi bacterium]|nr:aminoglycoside phosphotransferase family protein [Chloroflexota bacterium]MCI0856295.1 aminoglycoside phosphotransferase family protein [Chloroflexota bacterium]MCI0889759.1 aminoglycoside phosphotransferase family protein [Chloroflexota bacterium]